MTHPISLCNRLFVYGSLKRGHYNHSLLNSARLDGRCRLYSASLYSLGSYPMAVPSHNSADLIHGEVYEITAELLESLDKLEGHPNFYNRQLYTLNDGTQAWVYTGEEVKVAGRSRVDYGDWGSTPVFSYGSNMDPAQLESRCRHWDGYGTVVCLDGWRWQINKLADEGNGSGYAGIVQEPGSHCWGVVHNLSKDDLRTLDRREGVAIDHYRHEQVTVSTADGERFSALAYVPSPQFTKLGLRASTGYAKRILNGAAYWGLGNDWRKSLKESLQMTA